MSISRAFAKGQVKRLSSIPFFPVNETALSELTDAIQMASSETICVSVVSAFVDDSSSNRRCPTPGDVRRALQARANAKAKPSRCSLCGGSGFVTKYKLVTYKHGSYQILRAETLDLPFGEMLAFRDKLGPDQEILGAADTCSCLPAEHKVLTGEAD